MAVVEPPRAFQQVDDEPLPPHSPEFGHPEFDIAPEAFNAVHVVPTPCELVLMVMHTLVFVAFPHPSRGRRPLLYGELHVPPRARC